MSSHLRRYRRGQRIAAGAVLASSALFAPYLLALRPMVSYASQRADRSQLSPRSGSGPCSLTGAYTTVIDDTQLQAAVVSAQDDTQICIAPQIDDTIVLSQTLDVDDTTMTLVGADDTEVTLLSPSSARHISGSGSDDTLTVRNLTLNGLGASGGINLDGKSLVIQDDTLVDILAANPGDVGAAIYVDGGSLLVERSAFISNSAYESGGAIWISNSATGERTLIQNSLFEGNFVNGGDCRGGAIYVRTTRSAPAHISGSTFTGNFVDTGCAGNRYGGGAIATHSEVSLLIDDSTHFDGNSSQLPSGEGGGAILMDDTATLTIDGATFTDDSTRAGSGGAIAIGLSSTVTLTDAHFTNNHSGQGNGGAMYQRKFGSLAIYDSSFTGNHTVSGQSGGAIYSGSRLTVENSIFRSNYTSGQTDAKGGAISAGGGLDVAGSTFRENVQRSGSDGEGGAIYAYSVDDTVVIEGSLFVGNEAGFGGSVYLGNDASAFPLGALEVSNSTFLDDSAVAGGSLMTYGWRAAAVPVTLDGVTISGSRANGNEGGAIYALYTDLRVTNSTFFNNYSSQDGGAISGDDTTSVTIDFSTITDNSTGANSGAGITLNNLAPALTVRNSVVARNVANAGSGNDIDVASPTAVTLQSSFFTSDDTASIDVPIGTTRSGLLFGDPLLGDLGNNGGSYVGATGDDTFIPTQLPAAGSPLIGAGLLDLISPEVTVDQLGNSRVQSAFPNQTTIGALFRALPNPTPPTPSNPPSAPREVTATGGDASATVTWTAPASAGSFPITNYRATAAPGGASCLVVAPATTCRVEKLTNGTTYTFTVAALNGAGWGAESAPSNAVTPEAPTPPVEKTIVITGTRGTGNDNRTIYVAGTTTGLTGTVEPHYRFPGGQYTIGNSRPAITDDGTFTWKRRSGKKTYIFFTHGDVKSNRVIIAAR